MGKVSRNPRDSRKQDIGESGQGQNRHDGIENFFKLSIDQGAKPGSKKTAGEDGRSDILELLILLENLCNGFQFEKLESKLDKCCQEIGQHLDLKPDVIRSIARKYGLPPSLILICIDWLSNSVERNESGFVAQKIAQSVRYSIQNYVTRHGEDNISDLQEKIFPAILIAYRKFSDSEIQFQLLNAMSYLSPHLNANIFLPRDLQELICSNISANAKEFLGEQIRKRESGQELSTDWSLLSSYESTFKVCIRNGESVPDEAIEFLLNELSAELEENRSEAFALLTMADKNQDLSDTAYEALELEIAGRIYGLGIDSQDFVPSLKFLLERANSGKVLRPVNFTAFEEMICINEEITVLIINILTVTAINAKSIPNSLLNKLIITFAFTNDKNIVSHFCDLFSAVLKNNQTGTYLDQLKIKLEQFLESEEIESELFVEIFQVIVYVTVKSEFITFSEATLEKLIQRISTDDICRRKFMKTFLSILKTNVTSDRFLISVKWFFARLLCFKQRNISLDCFSGLLIISEKCRSIVHSCDLPFLLEFASESKDVVINDKIANLVAHITQHGNLTQDQKSPKDSDVVPGVAKDLFYYFNKLKKSERNDEFDYKEIEENVFCLKDIFRHPDLLIVKEAANLLKTLSMDKRAVTYITASVITRLLEIKELEDDENLSILVNDILNEYIIAKEGKMYAFNRAAIDRLCELADIPGNNQKYFRTALENVMDKIILPEESKRKIEMNFCFGNNKINIYFESNRIKSLENLECICEMLKEGSLLTFKQGDQIIEEVLKVIEEQGKNDKISNATAKMLLTFADLMSILIFRESNMLIHFCNNLAFLKIFEFIIKNQKWIRMENANIVSGFQLILKYVAKELKREFSVFLELIPSLLVISADINSEKFKIAVARYIYRCIAVCSDDKMYSHFTPNVISWLGNGLRDENSIIRVLSFDSFKVLLFHGRDNKVFENWCLDKLTEFSNKTQIFIPESYHRKYSFLLLRSISAAKFIDFDSLNGISLSKVHYEILVNELIQRCSSELSYFKVDHLSKKIFQLSSQQFYDEDPDRFCRVLQRLVISMDHGHLLASEMIDVFVFLTYLSYEQFYFGYKVFGRAIWKNLRHEALSTIIFEKLIEPLKNKKKNFVQIAEATDELN